MEDDGADGLDQGRTPTETSTAPTTGMSLHAHASGTPTTAKYGTQAALVMRTEGALTDEAGHHRHAKGSSEIHR